MNDELASSGVLVHEWLERTGGSENVFEVIADVFPGTPILASWNNAPQRFPQERVSETWLARTPLRRSKPLSALALPAVWRSKSLASNARWGLVSSHLFAHHVRLPEDAPKLVYVHTPARYVWSPELDPRGASALARRVAEPLKKIDRARAREATSVAANSAFVQRRIKQHWNRDAQVLHPPVGVTVVRSSVENAEWRGANDADVLEAVPEQFLLGVSRFVSYKRLDSVIDAGEAAGMPVVLAGAGPDEAMIRARAAGAEVPVLVVRHPSSAVLYELYRRASALVFPAVEDFGIVPVEAMAVGTPVIGMRAGGLLETVEEGRSGALVDEFGGSEFREALLRVQRLHPETVRDSADRFSESMFRQGLLAWVESQLNEAKVAV